MANVSFLRKQNDVTDRLNAMVTRARDVRSYLNTTVVRQYQTAQLNRWQTENASESDTWDSLNDRYAKWKAKKFASYPGGGKVMLVREGKLVSAATLRDGGASSYKIVTQTGIRIGINDGNLPYAKWVAGKRPFMSFGDATLSEMRAGLRAFIGKGQLTWRAG